MEKYFSDKSVIYIDRAMPGSEQRKVTLVVTTRIGTFVNDKKTFSRSALFDNALIKGESVNVSLKKLIK